MKSRLPFPAPWTWRPLVERNLPALASLATSVLRVDGGLPLSASPGFLKDRYLPEPPGKSLGCFTSTGMLVAAAAIQAIHTSHEYRCQFTGLVQPESRGHGLGRFLFLWGAEQGQEILTVCPTDRPHVLIGLIEGLTPAAEHLYSRFGFQQQFAEDVLQRDLEEDLPRATLPPKITLKSWNLESIPLFFQAYQASFGDRPGYPGWSEQQWVEWVTEDEDFLPRTSLLALRGTIPAGFITCSQDWIIQVGVCPAERGRGLGSALVLMALQQLRANGSRQVWLDVNVNNPGAARLYQRLGFTPAGRRARFARLAQPG